MEKGKYCRHCRSVWVYDWEYCPECDRNYGGAVYPALQTEEERMELLVIAAEIEQAFERVQLEDGKTIHEANLEGCYLNEQERMDARAKDTEHNWQEVAPEKIESFQSVLTFFDSKGWRFYMPAFMIWALKNWRTTKSVTADSVVWDLANVEPHFMDRYKLLTAEQARSVYRFLDFMDRHNPEDDAKKGIDAYWYKFAPESGDLQEQ
ncbi:MAG: hypothetical protein K9N23_12970 [Akkermansiaceae bacterium]|nr:hypothetical protein [Akkermansiaceae bacterium]MCF7732596.1 hypothetical protein [Akkermansiaceae bacterium]